MAFSSLLLFDVELSAFRGSSDLLSVLSALGTWSVSGCAPGAVPPPLEKVVSFPEEALGFMLQVGVVVLFFYPHFTGGDSEASSNS